jgi:hypothetical protein
MRRYEFCFPGEFAEESPEGFCEQVCWRIRPPSAWGKAETEKGSGSGVQERLAGVVLCRWSVVGPGGVVR